MTLPANTAQGRADLALLEDNLAAGQEARNASIDSWMQNDVGRKIERDLLRVQAGELSVDDLLPPPSEDELELMRISAARRADIAAFMKNDKLRARERELLERRAAGENSDSRPAVGNGTVPSSPDRYDLEPVEPLDTPEAVELDTNAREIFHELGVTQPVASELYAGVQHVARRFQNASEAEVQAHIDEFEAGLRTRWGASFDSKVEAFCDVIDSIPGALGDRIREQPWLLYEPRIMAHIERIAEARGRGV